MPLEDLPPVLAEPTLRRWHGLHQGELGGTRLPMWLGRTRWLIPASHPGRRGASMIAARAFDRRCDATFVLVDLGVDVAKLLPASGVSAYFREVDRGDVQVHEHQRPDADELRLESGELDRATRITVAGGDPVDWRRLFDPPFLEWLADDSPTQWQQRGRWLALFADGGGSFRADVPTMDSLMRDAERVARQFLATAGTPVS